jgi:uncharacterized protein YjcR
VARKTDRIDARMLYSMEMKEVAEISTILNVPEKTLYRWKQEDGKRGTDWDKDRESFRRTPAARAEELFEAAIKKFQEIVDNMAEASAIDSQALFAVDKILDRYEKMRKRQHMYPYILTMVRELTELLEDENSELLQELVPYLKKFGELMAKKYRRS